MHRSLDDRFQAPLRPRRELLEALWNFALWKTMRRRRRARLPMLALLKVTVWCQLSQAALIDAYCRHLKYLSLSHPITRRTLTRQLAAFRRDQLISVMQPRDPDRRTGKWRLEHNIYTITRAGILWIKKHGRAVKIPQVV